MPTVIGFRLYLHQSWWIEFLFLVGILKEVLFEKKVVQMILKVVYISSTFKEIKKDVV